MRVSGKRGLRATMSPPKPQPISAISTCFITLGVVFVDTVESLKAGKCVVQSIASGLAGLVREKLACARLHRLPARMSRLTIVEHDLRMDSRVLSACRISSLASEFARHFGRCRLEAFDILRAFGAFAVALSSATVAKKRCHSIGLDRTKYKQVRLLGFDCRETKKISMVVIPQQWISPHAS